MEIINNILKNFTARRNIFKTNVHYFTFTCKQFEAREMSRIPLYVIEASNCNGHQQMRFLYHSESCLVVRFYEVFELSVTLFNTQ